MEKPSKSPSLQLECNIVVSNELNAMNTVKYKLPDRDGCVKAEYLCGNGDTAFLLVAPDGYNLEVVVARHIADDGMFHKAESYWLTENDELMLEFLKNIFKGCSVYQ